ncbi:hypothetical protein pdam_00023438 [Pocillopora damicornis]|uniref:Peptidase C76 domain-containing protein n=1 Tax=Pocillopora damicornis TaxID=46731 RepID=A0A3M6TGU3_POCDA|nr:hypothetical protein pdam_00023438 [Pocillopora damicornis]
MFTCKHNRVFRRDREPSRIPEATLKRLRRKGRKLKEFVYERIFPSIPKSSWLRRYLKVRRVTKNDYKLNTKRVRLNKATKHDKKYLLNCSVRVYQRIIKLKYRARRPMCLYKSQTHASNYCKFQLISVIEKNPGPTPMYIDPSKTIMAPCSQANELVFGQNSGQQCVTMSLCSLIYNNKQGINSANDLVSIMNIGNQLYSSLSQLTKQSFLMQTELPTLFNMLETDYELQYSESYTGTIHQEATIEGYQYCTSLGRAFQSLISENFTNFVLTVGCTAVAIYCKDNTELPTLFNMLETDYELQYSESYTGAIHQEATIEGCQYCTSLDRAFQSLISENFNNFVLTVGCTAVAIYCKGNVGIVKSP